MWISLEKPSDANANFTESFDNSTQPKGPGGVTFFPNGRSAISGKYADQSRTQYDDPFNIAAGTAPKNATFHNHRNPLSPSASGENYMRTADSNRQQDNEKCDYYTRELLCENKRLWVELRQKNEMMIGLRDEIYFKQRQLEDLEKYRDEAEVNARSNDQYIEVIQEIQQLKTELREKQILINFLNDIVENLCDEVLQNEHIECMEMEIESLELENRKLTKDNSELKVKLKILEQDNEKFHTQLQNLDEEARKTKKKLDKTCKRLKEKENSMLSFKKFTDLANNLQSRIARSKSENLALRGVVERMKHVAENYENLESENNKLKETVADMEEKITEFKDYISTLQQVQKKAKEHEQITIPELDKQNAMLHHKLEEYHKETVLVTDKNTKLKANLKVYEKMLLENKSYIERVENKLATIDELDQENKKLREQIKKVSETLNRELSEKYRVVGENSKLLKEKSELIMQLKQLEKGQGGLSNKLEKMNMEMADIEQDREHLRKQLHVYMTTVSNQNITLKMKSEELEILKKENADLMMVMKMYNNQVQAAGRVYKQVTN